MADCLFCRIAAKEIPSRIVYEDNEVLAFNDISPQAPVHVLFIPKSHIPSLADAQDDQGVLLGRILLAVRRVAGELGLGAGYRVVNNCGAQGGQTVQHLHFHLLGGRDMQWPPG